jgi:hypothetical protein
LGLARFALCIAVSACAPKRLVLPADPGAPLPDFSAIHAQVTSACAGVRTLTAEIALSGRAGDQKLRGRVHAGFAAPGSMRLEGVAPFGPPAFILVSRDAMGMLLLPRDARIVRGAPGEILGALTGVSLAPADLQAILTGCVTPASRATAGRLHGGGWASIDLEDGATMYLQRSGEAWELRAARHGNWQIEYAGAAGSLPAFVSLHADSPVRVDLRAELSQVETNVDLAAAAFTVAVPRDAEPMSLDVLRANGPLHDNP